MRHIAMIQLLCWTIAPWVVFAEPPDANRLTYLDEFSDPYYPDHATPTLVTPQWVGEEGVEAVFLLAIDDMSPWNMNTYEQYLRPILERLKKIDGRAPVSIMSNRTNPKEPHLQKWLAEGLAIETHTTNHPCPLLQNGDFAKAADEFHSCIDRMALIPNSKPVAFRMTCYDSINNANPRFYNEIFNRTTPLGNWVSFSSSMAMIFTEDDPKQPRGYATDADGKPRFTKYTFAGSKGRRTWINYIENYPYPYVIGKLCWEVPSQVPDDWHGYRVFLWARNPKKLDSVGRTLQTLETWMDTNVGPEAHPAEPIRRLESLQALDEKADLVMDCIAEDMQQKTRLLRQFPHSKARGAVFITTTSGLSITEMGRLSGCGHQLAGTHFWNPPHLMPLVEVVRGEDTPDRVIEQVCRLVRSLGKIPVKVERDVPGFIGNRLLHALWREAIYLVERGIATPEDVDLVARFTFGLRMPAIGPLENMDLVGLDLVERIHEYLLTDLADNRGPSEYLTKSTREGRLGVKSGEGFYDWRSRDAEKVIHKRDMQIVHQLRFLDELENNRQGGQTQPAERKGR